ncbi:MAG: diversity-generating retroelement protein Avd [Candidatus Omnitrophota bacterium]
MNEQTELTVITKTYDLILWWLPQIIKFPRAYRFSLGNRVEDLLFEILEDSIEAKYMKDKIEILQRINLKLEKLRFLTRICKDLHFINLNKYEFVANQVTDIGKSVGGWLRQQKGVG